MITSRYTNRAITGGFISTLVMGLGGYFRGELSAYEAKRLIKKSIHGINTLYNTIALASTTILALLLTLFRLPLKASFKLKEDYYGHLLAIAKLGIVVFVCAVISFQLFNLPITEAENVSTNWFNIIYYVTLGVSSSLNAASIVVVIMLYNTVAGIIKILGLGITDHPFIIQEEQIKR